MGSIQSTAKALVILLCVVVFVVPAIHGADIGVLKQLNSSNWIERVRGIRACIEVIDSGGELPKELYQRCLTIIRQDMSGKRDVDVSTDEEMIYITTVYKLMLKMNLKEFIPYYFKSHFSKHVISALLAHGQEIQEEVLDYSKQILDSSLTKQQGYLGLLGAMAAGEHGYPVTDDLKRKIFNIVKTIDEHHSYPSAEYSKETKLQYDDIRFNIRRPVVDALGKIGNKESLQYLEMIAETDAYKRRVPEESVDMRMKKIRGDYRGAIKAMREYEKWEAVHKNDKKMVVFYPIREQAKLVIERLKTK